MPSAIRVTGAPRAANEPRIGYGYALPLSEGPSEECVKLFNEAWSPTPAMRHEPVVDIANAEILVSINLADKEVAAAALNKVVALVDETSRRRAEAEAKAAQDERANREVAREREAAADAFFRNWWEGRTRS